MKKTTRYLSVLITLVLYGCAVQKEYVATGGSRADGTIELSYEYGRFQAPRVNEQQGVTLAKRRCKAWGYSDAEPFGGKKQTCSFSDANGCAQWFVTAQYQCLGSLEK